MNALLTRPLTYAYVDTRPAAPVLPRAAFDSVLMGNNTVQLVNKPVFPYVPSRIDRPQRRLSANPFSTDGGPTKDHVPEDRPFASDWNIVDKTLLSLKTTFVTLPQTIVAGLRGDKAFSFSDAMLLGKVPYVLGGAMLVGSYLAGGNRREAIRQGAAVAMYLMGALVTNKLVDGIYRHRWGLDLARKYRSKFGKIEPMYASVDFARFDLLSEADYQRLAKKMGIPERVHNREGAVQEQIKYAIARSRTLKILLSTLLSAIGAGYMARTDAWLSVPDKLAALRPVWRDGSTQFFAKVAQSARIITHALKTPFIERLNISQAPGWKKAVVLGGTAVYVGGLLYALLAGIKQKDYDTTISPADWLPTPPGLRYRDDTDAVQFQGRRAKWPQPPGPWGVAP
ncbi:MAG: hypothetical protein KC474_05300 [Cyanobacteria bacterium HKST-UBA04]|nr:hypothetical protein [Cyanobacteria bacterium HKST-UBA04]